MKQPETNKGPMEVFELSQRVSSDALWGAQLTIPPNHDQPQSNEHDYCGFKLLRLISVVEEPYFEQFSKTYVGQVGDYADSFYNR